MTQNTLEEIVRRLIHLQDMKLTALQMSVNRDEAYTWYVEDLSRGEGIPIASHERVKKWDDEIQKQIELVKSDQDELLELVKKWSEPNGTKS